MMHAKSSVIDSRWVRIGSTDFSPLGVAINYAIDVIIDDAAIAHQAEQMFLEDLEQSKPVTLAKVPRWSYSFRSQATRRRYGLLPFSCGRTGRRARSCEIAVKRVAISARPAYVAWT